MHPCLGPFILGDCQYFISTFSSKQTVESLIPNALSTPDHPKSNSLYLVCLGAPQRPGYFCVLQENPTHLIPSTPSSSTVEDSWTVREGFIKHLHTSSLEKKTSKESYIPRKRFLKINFWHVCVYRMHILFNYKRTRKTSHPFHIVDI